MDDYLKLLKPLPDTPKGEIKTNYRKLVKLNHPDLFPQNERWKQNLILMAINEAYLQTLLPHSTKNTTKEDIIPNPEDKYNLLAKISNEDFVYYKLAIKVFQKGQTSLTASRSLKNIKNTTKNSILKSALTGISYFNKAYKYFYKITSDFPNSIWVMDAYDKLDELDELNKRYNKIINILTNSD